MQKFNPELAPETIRNTRAKGNQNSDANELANDLKRSLNFMMTMSRAISAGQASNYYKQEFTNSQDNYYREAGEVQGRWCGTLAEEWNLKGEVTSEQYDRLAAGQDPHTGEQLIRVVSARETVNRFGDEITTSEHRAAWDATISAPKSVSLAALVGGDGRIRDAHRESVNETLKEFEKYLQARGGGHHRVTTNHSSE